MQRSLVGILLCIGLCLLPSAALGVSPEEKSAARDAATAGIRAFQDGDYDTALELLRKAEEVVHAPPHLIYIARAHAAKSEYVLARETLMVLINEVLPADAPSAFHDAQTAGQALKAEIEPKIGRLSIHVEGAKAKVVVTVDGKVVPEGIVDLPYPVDPGLRTVVAKTETGQEDEVFVTVLEGQSQDVTLQLSPPSLEPEKAEPEPAAPPPPPPPKAEPKAARRGLRPLVVVGFGTAVAGVIVGSITGAISIAKTNDAKAQHCVDTACDSAAGPMLAEANTLANVSNVAFAVAGVGVGVGVLGLLSGPKASNSSRAASPRGRLAISPQGVRADLAWQF